MSSNVPAPEQQESTAPAASSSSAPAAPAARPATTPDDSLLCQWERCSERCPSAEALFEHICEKHVGRKSTNNLNLTCGWANCRTTTVKRDHITSHIRVHVPLKPHKCDFCGKSFKRPQDLKKHVKTHADDSVLLRTPEQHSQGAYRQVPKPGPQGYYDHQAAMHHAPAPSYGPPPPQGGAGYYMHQPMSFGQGYYPVHPPPPDMGHNSASAAYDAATRRRQNDIINEFFGDIKRRQFDPTSYAEVGQRLVALHGLPISGTLADYMVPIPQPIPVGGLPHPPVPTYALPLPNVRTKNELQTMDSFLDQMQTTLYENANAAAAAGVQQPGAHYTHQAINFRQSHSPPQTAVTGVTSASSYAPAHVTAPMMPSHSSQSTSSGTAALTPPSSSVSHASGHSPGSSHGVSPSSRQGSGATYPILPPVSAGYAAHPSAAPTSTLANNFDPDPRRRFSGGMLQRSANTRVEDEPAAQNFNNDTHKGSGQNIDPALGANSPSNSSSSSSSTVTDRDEAWLLSARALEQLRYVIKYRVEHHYYEGDDGIFTEAMRATAENVSPSQREPEQSSQGLYPDLRAAMH